jgi:hypothetical protein
MSSNLEMLLVPVCGGLITLVMFAGGIFGIVWSLRSRKKASQSTGWPAGVGAVTQAQIRENRSTDEDGFTTTTYTPKIQYQFNIGGAYYTGDRITFGFDKTYNRRKKAQEALAAYPLHGQVRVFYNPQNPNEAVLVQKAQGSIGGIIGGVILILISACLACPALGAYLWNNF